MRRAMSAGPVAGEAERRKAKARFEESNRAVIYV